MIRKLTQEIRTVGKLKQIKIPVIVPTSNQKSVIGQEIRTVAEPKKIYTVICILSFSTVKEACSVYTLHCNWYT